MQTKQENIQICNSYSHGTIVESGDLKIKRVHSNKNAGCPRQIIQPRFPQTTRSDWWDERPMPTHNDVIGWSVAFQALPGC